MGDLLAPKYEDENENEENGCEIKRPSSKYQNMPQTDSHGRN
jgi:hypothetical protein